eukprot:3933409-Rhodomonas_salina.3
MGATPSKSSCKMSEADMALLCQAPMDVSFADKTESWILMALQQAKAVVHLLSPPEIVTVGHNPYTKGSIVEGQITLSQ